MKIIDEKGRLFGKINIIDFAVIVFALVFIPLAYLGYNIATADSKKNAELISVNIQVRFAGVMPKLAGFMKADDFEKDIPGRRIGKIVSYEVIPPQESTYRQNIKYISRNGESEKAKEESDQVVTTMPASNSRNDMIASIDIMCYMKNGTLFYKEQPVKIGKEFTFSTNLYEATGVIIDIKK
ncbi:MAG: DUF4330 domain-containing protein [Candidatus Omnitrophota bacterium]|nr:DUF4330 domain-containing protein [Candidatus Omnitrophota bacterium]